jgi:hypothetical protein
LDSPAKPSPIIVEIEVAYEGKNFDARAVVGTDLGAGPQTAPPEIFNALRKANAILAEKLRQNQ